MVARKLGLAQIDLYASPGYSASHGLPTQESELAAHRIVVFDGPNTPRRVNDWIFDRVDKDQIHMRCADLKSVETAVRMGVGVGPLPVGLLGTSDGLQRTGLIPASVASTVWLVTNPEAHQREEVRAFNGQDYVMEYGLTADFALIKCRQADRLGNLVYNKTARNFAPIMAMAGRRTIVQAGAIVPVGTIDPECVVTPGIFVNGIVEVTEPLHESLLVAEERSYP